VRNPQEDFLVFTEIPVHHPVIMAQAQALSYVDIYRLLAATSGPMFLLCFLLAKNEPGKGGQAAVH
jgi:ABC-type Na+ efflux pump permease subunit